VPTIDAFYRPYAELLAKKEKEIIKKAVADEPTDRVCEKCGKPMVIKTGRFGKFLSCSGFPECRNSRPLRIATGARCPLDGGDLLQQRGRARQGRPARPFYGCSNYPNCKFTTTRKPLKEPCPECGKLLVERGREGAQCLSCKYTGPRPDGSASTETADGAGSAEAMAPAEA
jgi:DNA topoisomerase-1